MNFLILLEERELHWWKEVELHAGGISEICEI